MGMLILSRMRNEDIVIPTLGVVVRVMDIRGDKVRLGIDAPRDVPAHRREIWDRIVGQAVDPSGGREAAPTPDLPAPSAEAK